jgi:hypothetical protein
MSTGSQRLLGAPPGIAPGGGGDPRRAAQASAVALRRRVGLEPQGKRAVGPPLRRPEGLCNAPSFDAARSRAL